MKRARGADEETAVLAKSACRVPETVSTSCPSVTQPNEEKDEETVVEELKHVNEMHAEFGRRRKITLSGLPIDSNEETVNEVLDGLDYTIVSTPRDGTVKLLFPDVSQAKVAIQKLNGLKYGSGRISASFGHPDSFLFVGNIPLSYFNQRLKELFAPCGEILRSFIVYSTMTGRSKGYGFVEFAKRDEALLAKQKMATKVVGLRSLRVDFADNGMQTCEDLQSCTLFVDKLPKGMSDNDRLRNEFIRYGTVNFCQIALNSAGSTRGFAFIDMNTSAEAELAQATMNCSSLDGHDIRVSFGMPCRPGACILQPRNPHPFTSTWLVSNSTSTPPVPSWGIPSVSVVGLFVPDHTNTTRVQALVSLPTNTLPTSSSYNSSLKQLLLSSSSSSTDNTLTGSSTDSSNKENETITRTTEHEIIKHQETTGQAVLAGHKRRHARADLTELRDEEAVENGRSVYDKPFLGQHQQGIPFTHPLKRIRMQ